MSARWDVERDGVEVIPALIAADRLDRLVQTCPRGDAGVRSPLAHWEAGRAAARTARDHLAERWGRVPLLTRAILFDKRSDANWHLRLHQDVTIAVAARVEAPGFGPWSVKGGDPHVTPPAEMLAAMVTVRVHLDRADEDNGCLRAVLRSHLSGHLVEGGFDPSPAAGVAVPADAGDAVLMKPLVLHGSERSRSDARRRVLHMEFAFDDLPAPVAWAPINIG